MRSVRWSTVLLYGAVFGCLGAAVRERMALIEAREEWSTLFERTKDLATHRKALFWQVNQVELTRPFLQASRVEEPESDELQALDPGNAVLYLLSTECPICPSNYPFLNDLADSGVPVFGLVFNPSEGSVKEHREGWDIRFPILVNPHGSAVNAIPRFGTPTTVVVSDHEVVFLEFGEFNDEKKERLSSITRSWLTPEGDPTPARPVELPEVHPRSDGVLVWVGSAPKLGSSYLGS